MKRFHTGAALVVGATLAVACSKKSENPSKAPDGMEGMKMGADSMKPGEVPGTITMTAAQVQHGGVKWAPVTLATTRQAASVPGEVTPNEDRTARLGAPARGRIVSVAVRTGDAVSAGQALVTMQSPEAGVAQSDVAKAAAEVVSRRAEAQYAASARARAERLLALKAIPRQDYDRAVSDDERARAALTQAEAEQSRARATASQLSATVDASGDIVIRAPQAGVVLARTAVPGAVVDAGAPLVVITDPGTLWLSINAPESMSTLFHRGDKLRFVLSAMPTDTLAAQVNAVGAGLEPDTRTLTVRADIQRDARIKPQMLATVFVAGASGASLPMIADDAVQLVQGKPHVFVARQKEKGEVELERRAVTPGARANGQVTITNGLKGGEVIVVAGAFAVKTAFEKSLMPKMEM
jgi:cobalt-zinc-cadmium efflux system membrane fusion protein